MVVCCLGSNDPEVLPMRTGSNDVGASAVETGESNFDSALTRSAHRLYWYSEAPCFNGFGW